MGRKKFFAVPLLLLCQTYIAQEAPDVDASTYIVEKNVMLAMRDGVRLATDLYFPARDGKKVDGKFPAIMERTPYDKERSPSSGSFWASHGYVYISQDTRGRFHSEGIWHLLTDDVNDGYDTAKWIVGQPWSSGKFGMEGGSYVGGTQHAMAMSNPPGFAATIPVDAASNAGYFGVRYGGAFELRLINWVFFCAPWGSRASRDAGTRTILEEANKNFRQYIQSLPIRRGTTPLRLAVEYEDWLVFGMGHGEIDAYWKHPALDVPDNVEKYKDFPVYLVGGWFDSWARQTTMNYEALSKAKKGPIRLIMGPWTHGNQDQRSNGQVEFGADAAIDYQAFQMRWYDRWLKDIPNGVEKEAPVRIYVMGGGSEDRDRDKHVHGGAWRDETEWPLARTKFTPYYFHSGGVLSAEKPTEQSRGVSFEFDPKNPVPTIGGNTSSAAGLMLQGAWDQKCGPHVWNCADSLPLSARRDVLVFMTAPLKEDMEVTGPIDVQVWVSSSAQDTDFTAKLIDVHPPTADFPAGIDMNLEDGILRGRFHNSLEKAELLKPGEIYRFTIKLYPTSNIFKAGHRIRLDISSSNFPRFDVNPNSGEPLNDYRRMVTATNTVYFDAEHPSHVILPVIPKQK